MITFRRSFILAVTIFLSSSSIAFAQFPPFEADQTPGAMQGAGVQSFPQTSPAAQIGSGTLPLCSVAELGQPCVNDNPGEVRTGTEADDLNGSKPAPAGAQQQNAAVDTTVQHNDFQDYVTLSVGLTLPLFGYDLFSRVPSTFAPVTRIPVNPDYVIGPGDQLQIRVWGAVDLNVRATVDRNGLIYIPRVGSVSVTGLKYADVTAYLRAAIARVFRNFEMNVTLGELRSIEVFVVGQARRPGSYTVSSLSTLLNALFASGGPSTRGSLRDIQLKRDGKVVAHFDLYDLLLRGDKTKDLTLQPGDVIYIPPIGELVAITGGVKSPAIYEIKRGNVLGDLLQYSGGLSVTAAGQHVSLERVFDHATRRMAQFDLDPSGLEKPLQDGDIVTVFKLSRRFDNAITLRGNVAVPGRYPWHEGMRVKDLIPDKQALITPEYWLRLSTQVAEDRRRLEEPKLLLRRNGVEAESQAAGNDKSKANPSESEKPVTRTAQSEFADIVSGQRAIKTTAHSQDQLRSEIRPAPEINWDYAVIQRLDEKELRTSLLPFNLEKAIAGDPQQNLQLEAGDIITIFSTADIQIPLQQQTKFVRLEGEVASPGVYKVEPGETLRSLVARVGGLSAKAYLFGAQFTRESTRVEQQKNLDQLADTLERDLNRITSFRASNPEDAVGLAARVDAQRQLIAKVRATKALGRIVLNIRPDQETLDAIPEITLEDGDRLFIPYKPSTVGVVGAVYNDNDLLYRQGRRVADYLRSSGGTRREADRSHIYIVRADGSVQGSGSGSGLFTASIQSERLMPGDTIVVPENFNKTPFLRNLKDYSAIFYQFALGAAAINVLK